MARHPKNSFHWRGRVFDFKVEETTLPNAKDTTIEMIHHPGSSAIVPIQGDHSVVLLRQYRPAIRAFIWEIPAGTMRGGEDPLACAKRELEEECGLIGSRFEKIGEVLTAPGYSDERIHLFLATELVACEQKLDEDEYLEIHSFPFEEVVEMMRRGEIRDAMSIVGLHRAYSELKENLKQPIPISKRMSNLSVKRLNRILTMLLYDWKDLSDEGRDFPIRWNIMHMYSSSQIAKILAIRRGLNSELAGIAAALHDMGVVLTKKHEGHAKSGEDFVDDFIRRYNAEGGIRLRPITDEERDLIVKAIIHHSEKEIDSSDPFVELLKDADSIDRYLHGVKTEGSHLERCRKVIAEFGL